MKLTNRSEYALLALIELARHYEQGLLSGDCLAERQGIPKRFLQQILFSLKRGGYIRSVKGKAGGYALVSPPQAITIAEIVRFFEGALAPTTSTSRNFYQPSPIEHEKGLVHLFFEIRDQVATILETTTLSDVSRPMKLARTRRRA